MEVTTTTKRIAQAGAKKMSGQGYTYRRSALNGNVFRVVKPNNAGFYFVQLPGAGTEAHCMCRFFADNGYCKHLEWIGERVAEEAEIEARAAQWERDQEAENWARWEAEVRY